MAHAPAQHGLAVKHKSRSVSNHASLRSAPPVLNHKCGQVSTTAFRWHDVQAPTWHSWGTHATCLGALLDDRSLVPNKIAMTMSGGFKCTAAAVLTLTGSSNSCYCAAIQNRPPLSALARGPAAAAISAAPVLRVLHDHPLNLREHVAEERSSSNLRI